MKAIASAATETLAELVASERLDQARLGLTPGRVQLSGREPMRLMALALCQQARRQIRLFSQGFDPYSYSNLEFYQAVRTLVLRRPGPGLQVILQDNEGVQRKGHRLLDLAQRLSSGIQIYRPQLPEHRDHAENFLLVDGQGYLYQPLRSRPQASAAFHDPSRVRELDRFFEQVRQYSEADSQLRRLCI